MSTVKRLDDRGMQRLLLRVRKDHGGPCNRLQRDPMQSNRAAKRANRRDAPDMAKHKGEPSGRSQSSQSTLRFRKCRTLSVVALCEKHRAHARLRAVDYLIIGDHAVFSSARGP
jgi:hypothetical protein